MRRRLLILLSLLVLLMQPAGLLHGLAHLHDQPRDAAPVAAAGDDEPALAAFEACLDCMAYAAIGHAPPPAATVLPETLATSSAPVEPLAAPHGGTAAGYHARGPPTFLA